MRSFLKGATVLTIATILGILICIITVFIFPTAETMEAKGDDEFEYAKRITVINSITDETKFQMEGYFTVVPIPSFNQLKIISKCEDGSYSEQVIGLSENTMYMVEDIKSIEDNKQ